jgi:hypothetical protein
MGVDPGSEVGLGLEHLDRRHPSFEEGPLDVGAPPVGLGLGDPAQAVCADPKPALDHEGPNPVRELELDRRHDRQLVLADPVLRSRLREADRLANHLQQVHVDPGALAELAERRVADLGESIERARIEVGEGKRSVADGGGHPVERHAGLLQAVHPSRPEHVALGEGVVLPGPQDPELDQSVDVGGIDPCPSGHLLARVLDHGKRA